MRGRYGLLDGPAFETRVAGPEDDALQAAVAGNEFEVGSEERPVVFVGLRIEQVNAGDIAFAAFGRVEAAGAAYGKKLRADAVLLQFAEEVVEPNALAADDDEIGQLKVAAQKLDADDGSGLNDLFVAADGGESVGAAEGGDTARPLAHGICRKGYPAVVRCCLHQPDEEVFRSADLAVHFDGETSLNNCARLRTPAGEQPDDRRDEFMKRKDRRGREPGQHHDRTAAGGR